MEHPLANYKSLHDFFTRRLRHGVRPIDENPLSLISPVDGVLSEMGEVSIDKSFFIKNQQYYIEQIFGDEIKAAPYKNGYYFVLYLSPSHYHRIHYPITGQLASRYALGTKSFPVNNFGIRFGDKPFSTNYRLISELTTAFGKVALVKVGALNINSIQVVNSSPSCVKGEELGYFSFGSTVLLFIENREMFKPTMQVNTEIKMGQPLGVWAKK